MKTLDEVIKAFEQCNDKCYGCTYHLGDRCIIKRNSDALHYLKEYRDDRENFSEAISNCGKALNKYIMDIHSLAQQEDNLPLTWEELKAMKDKPVWIELLNDKWKGWDVIAGFDEDDMVTVHNDDYYKADLGKSWQAYRKER